MFSEERREQILEKLKKEGRLLAKELANEYNLSLDSIRRDLSIMEEQGLLKRTHGGAIPIPNVRTMPIPPSMRYGDVMEYQNAIAKEAVTYINEGQTVFIGGAAIHYVLLKYLPRHIEFTVITNAVEVAYYLREVENIQLYLIGGAVKSSGNITDALANEFACQFTIDLCFATAGGLSLKGLSTATPEVSIFHKTVYDNSKKVIGLIEHSKFGIDLFSRMYPLQKLDKIITDEETTKDNVDSIRAQGIEVIVAGINESLS
ncbi:DeoR/GlpR transcriptional regulator [Psychrobacillus glaciei]|uniref:DeoR/GlpR transcriptional regulator n=1 Tax=Psychrobacillus glaciei TaxID=2283160 RepID=A0A5J6ST50_9BACI|nr:DeoR/GlpR family DNA-binding transcription regulator [Psychrobacillus glaciei]QFG00075.1 DeoR/GlpR transcriptional regulator [Psychrobacillus glaciei]